MNTAPEDAGSIAKRGLPKKCLCGLDVSKFTSKTQENPGRPFFRCKSYKEDHLFKWVEDAVCEEVEDAVPKLIMVESEISRTSAEVAELKIVVEELEEHRVRTDRVMWNCKLLNTFICICLCVTISVIVYLMLRGGKNKIFLLHY